MVRMSRKDYFISICEPDEILSEYSCDSYTEYHYKKLLMENCVRVYGNCQSNFVITDGSIVVYGIEE